MKANKPGALTSRKVLALQQNHKLIYDQKELPSRASVLILQELLGRILFSFNWNTTSNSDNATLLLCVDGLGRRLIDLRCRGGLDG